MTVKNIVSVIEKLAPLYYQESYDNAGLLIGEPTQEVSAVLICFDVTEDVLDEAIQLKANLIISHHPAVFSGLKRLNGFSPTERIAIKAIKNDIAVYAAHTNLDNVTGGINSRLCDKLELINQRILVPKQNELVKLVCFVPQTHAETVRNALFEAQAGHIGNYDCCSFNTTGEGTFRAGENTHPFIGKKGELHIEPEIRIETIVKRPLIKNTVNALLKSHPYEEVAYDIYPIDNEYVHAGSGMLGELKQPLEVTEFLQRVKSTFNVNCLRYSTPHKTTVSRVAVCGGSGAAFIADAIKASADVFITGDCKYHQFLDVGNKITLVDIGHYESEYFATEIFYELISKNFSNFAVYLAKTSKNPVNYL